MNTRRAFVCCIVSIAALCAPRLIAQGYPAEEAPAHMTVPPGFEVELVVSEPTITQPVCVEFDDRGRMWVVQYIQYPNPEGLKRVEVDRYSRTKYDKVPDPPPHGPKGADRITILEDTDGDGRADTSKDFLNDLNLCSGVAFGYDGVFVLNVPYLLFYPDRDHDDVPDSDPEVLIKGFGMEDAHSVANSLTWGPDGWLYGLQGSTVTANIDGNEFQQGIWRYHPKLKKFELFAEGGGNMWGMDFSPEGHLITCTNVGGFMALHAVQGAYYWKAFGKHGALHNPYAFGYFEHLTHDKPEGGHVSVGATLYEADAFPAEYQGQFIAANLLSHNVYRNDLVPVGSTFETKSRGELMNSNDTWFASSDMALGPDGSLYVADWNDRRTAHPDPDAEWDRSNGRVYRIKATGTPRTAPFNLREASTDELIKTLDHPNKWWVRRAQVNLAMREDAAAKDTLTAQAFDHAGSRHGRNAFFALYGAYGLDHATLEKAINSDDPVYRRWAVRYIGDAGTADDAKLLKSLPESETDVHVLSQLASTAKRLDDKQCMHIVRNMVDRNLGADDPHIPLLLWWATEAHAVSGLDRWVEWAEKTVANATPLFADVIAPRLVRRYAADGSPQADWACGRLLRMPMDPAMRDAFMLAADQGLEDRAAPDSQKALGNLFDQYASETEADTKTLGAVAVQPDLRATLQRYWRDNPDSPTAVRLAARVGLEGSITKAQTLAANPDTPMETRLAMIEIVGRFGGEADGPWLMDRVRDEAAAALRPAALAAMRRLPGDSVGADLIELYAQADADLQSNLRDVLFSRSDWALSFAQLVDAGTIAADDIPLEQVRALARHENADLQTLVEKHWGSVKPGTAEEKLAQMRSVNNELNFATGDPARGKAVFAEQCGKCHTFFGAGAHVGPDLTQSNRMDREYLLASLVDPNLTIRKEYEQFVVETHDGGMYNGLIADQTQGSVVLLNANDERTTIATADVAEIREAGISLMPEDLLKALSGDDIRNLFAYLQAEAPDTIEAAPAEPEVARYENTLTRIENPKPLLAEFPQYVDPVIEEAHYEAPAVVNDSNADLNVRSWRFSYNARGIIEMPNHLCAQQTAIVVVHPWGIDDSHGWITPQPAGVADFCTPIKNKLGHEHVEKVLNPFLQRMRPNVAMVLYSQPGKEDPIRKKMYRSVRSTPTDAERDQGRVELQKLLNSFDYTGEPLVASFDVNTATPVIDYFKQFPGIDSSAKYNGEGFWDLPIPIIDAIDYDPSDVLIYDQEGYEVMRDFLKAQGIRHILLTGYCTDMCFKSTTAGYENLSKDFNVFLVGDATLATFPSNTTPAHATNASLSYAALNQMITQMSWIEFIGDR